MREQPSSPRPAAFHRRFDLFDTRGMSPSLRRSLYMVIWGVTIYMVCNSAVTGAPWTGFQREILRADDFQLGLIAAIPVVANVLQIFISVYMERKRNRRFLFLFFGILGRTLWIVIGLLPFFIPASEQMLRVLTVIALVGLISTGNCFVNLGFASLMGDLVPMRIRGSYFAVRQKVSLVSGILSGLVISAIVDSFGTVGYSVALILAGIAGCLDLCCFFRVDWPPMAEKSAEESQEKTSAVIMEVFKNRTFMRFAVTFTLWGFATNISAPFFNVFMLEDLRMSYTTITVYNYITCSIATVLVASFWGRKLDVYGSKPVMQFTFLFVSLVPVLWLFMNPGNTWLILVSNVTSGLFASPADLAQMNLYLGLSPQKNRSVYVAVFFVVYNVLGIALGNAAGGWLMQNVFGPLTASGLMVGGVAVTKFQCIIVLTTLLRLCVTFLAVPRMHEPGARSLGDFLRRKPA